MTQEAEQPKQKTPSLQEQLKEKQRLEREERESISNNPPTKLLSPQERQANAEAEIKAFKAEQDVQSIKLGYENFQVRENSIADREKNISEREDKLKIDIGEFELQQKERVAKVNENIESYNKAYEILKTERTEAQRIMADAIALKSESENIIKSQTEQEKIHQIKSEAYKNNMDESIILLDEIVKYLRRFEDRYILNLAVILNRDLSLIDRLIENKVNLQTLADIITVDCSKIIEVCEYLQDSKDDFSKVTNYLLKCTDWLEEALKIDWIPNEKEGMLK